MDNLFLGIRKAIYKRILPDLGTNSVKTIISNKLAYFQADEKWKIPYIVFYYSPIVQTNDTSVKFHDVSISFLIAETTLQKCEILTQNLIDILEDSEAYLQIDDRYVIEIIKLPTIAPTLTEQVWNATVQYKLKIQT